LKCDLKMSGAETVSGFSDGSGSFHTNSFMGGTPGQGIDSMNQVNQMTLTRPETTNGISTAPSTAPNGQHPVQYNVYAGQQHQQQQQQQHQQQQQQQMLPSQAGSITQFASASQPHQPQMMQHSQQPNVYQPQMQVQYQTHQQPVMQHQHQHQQFSMPQQPQQHYQTHQQPYPTQQQSSQFIMSSAPPASSTYPNNTNFNANVNAPQQSPAATAGSYAARSAQAYAVHGGVVPSSISAPAPPQPHVVSPMTAIPPPPPTVGTKAKYADSPAVQAQQTRVLNDCTRKVQESAYYMKQAMDKDNLSEVLDRAAQMVGELGDSASGTISPKNYYELHMRALDDMPNLEEYLLALATSAKCRMKDLYNYVQFCPKVLPRLYLQISAGSALIRSKEETSQWVLTDLIESVKCVQNPLRGLFLRHFLLQATRDKLPDGAAVKDGYTFVLANFMEMNKLWVRIQHLPGEGKSKEQRKKRERERNELRILVGTNLVRLSQLDGVTSAIYGQIILPQVLEQITACGDPLAQAYLIDCIIQVFPDEYHIETLSILLAVCPKLRDKVNIRTILQSLMDRLATYYAEEELLDGELDTNEVKKSVFNDSFPMFEHCVQNVYNARGPKLTSKEVIRLQTALLKFSLKCYPGNMEQVNRCLGTCITFIRQAAQVGALANQTTLPEEDGAFELDEASVVELEKMLSIPLDSLALKVLQLDHYSDLLRFLPWENRRDVSMTMLGAIDSSGDTPNTVKELEELFSIISPVIKDPEEDEEDDGMRDSQEEINLVSKLVHLLHHHDLNVTHEMLVVARNHLSESGENRESHLLVPVVFASLGLVNLIQTKKGEGQKEEITEPKEEETPATEGESTTEDAPKHKKATSTPLGCRKVFVFIQTTITMLAKSNAELAVKLFLHAALASDALLDPSSDDKEDFTQITHELLVQAFFLHEEEINEPKSQRRCVVNMVAALLACKSLTNQDYESLVTKSAQYAAKLLKKEDQCEMVTMCSHLFYPIHKGENGYSNPQRTLECLQRSLKLADASTVASPGSVYLFVDLLEHYVYFFEHNNPVITEAYVTGLIALIKEHLESYKAAGSAASVAVANADAQFQQLLNDIKRKQTDSKLADRFKLIQM